LITLFLAMLQTPYDHLLDAPHPLVYSCVRGTPKIDGSIGDAAWSLAEWTEYFVDIEGSLKPLPRFKTRAKMLWDDAYLYIAADMEEPHVWATLTEHDSVIFYDNDFEVFIDPDGDNHDYYEIEINALNTEWDLRLPRPYRDGGPALNEWEIPGLRKAINVRGTINDPRDTDQGWSVELVIPWSAIGGKPSAGGVQRINFSRVDWQVDVRDGKYVKRRGLREDNWVWSSQWVIDMHQPQMWGYIQFVDRGPESRYVDQTHTARMSLHHIYYRQKAYREKNDHYAANAGSLGLTTLPGFLREPRIHITEDGYTASGVVQTDRGPRLLEIRQDSLIRMLESQP
jgi:hypothetical protein